MPFIPHTQADIDTMLAAIGAVHMEDLFDEIPAVLRAKATANTSPGMSEMEISRLMEDRAREDGRQLLFIGAGAYDHHIPAAVWQLASRGEFYTAYTPYQAEASQGTLQLLYEYQSMMTALTAMEVSNASLYDGASALAEAVLMAARLQRKAKTQRVLVPRSLHPAYRQTLATIVRHQEIELIELAFDPATGSTDLSALDSYTDSGITALVIPQPNFFGVLEPVHEMTRWAADQKAISIAVVNPLALGILSPPGEWNVQGVDIACGEGQPLGIPLSYGGPYFGFLCCRKAHARQLPGRIVGRTRDKQGEVGYTLTLQAREQHIRRAKATSNICTNQGLMVTAATIHMALLGSEGLARTAASCHQNLLTLNQQLTGIPGIAPLFSGPVFHERVYRLPAPTADVLRSLAAHGILGGYDLSRDYPELSDALLICATEKRTEADLSQFGSKLARILQTRTQATCPSRPQSL